MITGRCTVPKLHFKIERDTQREYNVTLSQLLVTTVKWGSDN